MLSSSVVPSLTRHAGRKAQDEPKCLSMVTASPSRRLRSARTRFALLARPGRCPSAGSYLVRQVLDADHVRDEVVSSCPPPRRRRRAPLASAPATAGGVTGRPCGLLEARRRRWCDALRCSLWGAGMGDADAAGAPVGADLACVAGYRATSLSEQEKKLLEYPSVIDAQARTLAGNGRPRARSPEGLPAPMIPRSASAIAQASVSPVGSRKGPTGSGPLLASVARKRSSASGRLDILRCATVPPMNTTSRDEGLVRKIGPWGSCG